MKLKVGKFEVERVDAATQQAGHTFARYRAMTARAVRARELVGAGPTLAAVGEWVTYQQQRWATALAADKDWLLGPFEVRRARRWVAANADRYVVVPDDRLLVVPLRHLQWSLRETRGTDSIAAELAQAVFALAGDTAALVTACRPARELMDRAEDDRQLERLMVEHPQVSAMVAAYVDAFELLESAADDIEAVLERVDDAFVLATLSEQALAEAVAEVQAVVHGLRTAGAALQLPPALDPAPGRD